MKKTIKFFLVAIAATAMLFSSCNKEDETNEPEIPTPIVDEPATSINDITITKPIITSPVNGGILDDFSYPTMKFDAAKADKTGGSFSDYKWYISYDDGKKWLEYHNDFFEHDQIVCFKVVTEYTFGSDKKTVESDIIKCHTGFYNDFVFAVTEYNENSLTVKDLNPLPHDYCEITLCKASVSWLDEKRQKVSKFNYTEAGEPIKLENGKEYKFSGLEAEQNYAVKYSYVKDGKVVIEGHYHAMTINPDEYAFDGIFKKIKLAKVNGQTWAIQSRRDVWYGMKYKDDRLGYMYSCDGRLAYNFDKKPDYRTNPLRRMSYGFRFASKDDWNSLFTFLGGKEMTYTSALLAKNAEWYGAENEPKYGTDEYGFGIVYNECFFIVTDNEISTVEQIYDMTIKCEKFDFDKYSALSKDEYGISYIKE